MQYHTLTLSDLPLALLLLFLSSSLLNLLTSRGGPMLWPVLGILPTFFFHSLSSSSNVYDWATSAARSSGGTFPFRGVWLGRCHGVITLLPANLKYILHTRFHNFPKGRYYRHRFADFLGDGIFNADGDAWLSQRRSAAAEMHSSRFADYSFETVSSLVRDKLVPLLDELAATGSAVDLQDVLLRFTFDNICTAAFGVDPGCLTVELPEVPFARAFEAATELTLFRFTVPPVVWKVMRAMDVGTERRLREAIWAVHGFAERTVEERRQGARGSDLLSRLMEVRELGMARKIFI